MDKLTLLVMAAGMGSRYGGLKQLDPVGPNGETIIEYSLYDAIQTGFDKVIFIIRKEFEKEFKIQITNKFSDKIKVEFSFQQLNDLPLGYSSPSNRVKPWGTGHAILSASKLINEPFIVINGDDFYGRKSFSIIADFYKTKNIEFSMVAFQLDKTLSDYGGVSRGLCSINNNNLETVVETEKIIKTKNIISCQKNIELTGNEPVSMNMWGFTPNLFNYLKNDFIDFLNKEGNEINSEFLIPTVINNLIKSNIEKIKVLHSNEKWFGVTYKEDKPFVIKEINKLINLKVYPEKLF